MSSSERRHAHLFIIAMAAAHVPEAFDRPLAAGRPQAADVVVVAGRPLAADAADAAGRPLAADAADATGHECGFVGYIEMWECETCGEVKNPVDFQWDEGFNRHRRQCGACDGYWKRLHYQIKRQQCRALYYEQVKPDQALRKALYEAFHVHAHDLQRPSGHFDIKTWAVAHGLLPVYHRLLTCGNGADDTLPATGGVVLAGASPAPGGFGRENLGGEGPPSSSSSSKRFRASIVSVTRVGIEAGGSVSVKTRTKVV